MCLIVVGWRVHPDYPLVVAANRDEFYARPTAQAARWPDARHIIGGLDREAGGTWLGISETGRFAAVTNVREPGMAKGQRSRGELTRNFLLSEMPADDYARPIDGSLYAGFNLLLSDGDSLYYASNRDGEARPLAPGVYGLSNHLLDSPWPKLIKARERFTDALQHMPEERFFFDLLADRSIVSDAQLPATGVPIDWERLLSAVFVTSDNYGTRASTVLWQTQAGDIHFHEQSFGPHGQVLQSSVISTSL